MSLSILRPGNSSTTTLAVIAAVNAVIALVYYVQIGKAMWMDPDRMAQTGPRWPPP